MSTLTPERLAEIRERVEAASRDTGLQYDVSEDLWAVTGDKPTARLLMYAPEDVADLLAEVERLRAIEAGVEALHSAVQEYESCPAPYGCDDDACTESVHNGERYHADQPVGHICLTCRDEDGAPLDWPCATAALLNPTEGETDDPA